MSNTEHENDEFEGLFEEGHENGFSEDEFGHEHEHEHDEGFNEEEGELEEEHEGDGEDDEETSSEKKESKFSKLIMPVGIGILVLVTGGVGWTVFGPHGSSDTQVAANGPVQPPMLNHPPVIPAGLQHRLPQRPLPTPVVNNSPNIQPALPGNENGNTVPVTLPAATNPPVVHSLPDNAPVSNNSGEGTSKVESAILKLIDTTQALDTNLSKRFEDMDTNLKETKDAVTSRLDTTDSNVSKISTQVQSIGVRMDDLDSRLKNIETGSVHIKKVPEVRDTKNVERRSRSHATIREHKDVQEVAVASVSGYTLRGIEKVAPGQSPKSAWIQTPGGFIVAKVGQSAGHLGVIKSISQKNGVWVVNTSAGIVNP